MTVTDGGSCPNKEESLRCLAIAKAALSAGDTEKAERFLRKACRMDTAGGCPEARRLLDQMTGSTAADGDQGQRQRQQQAEEDEEAEPTPGGGARRRRASSGGGGHAGPEFTDEQANGVARIRQAKDYYEILGVAKDANDDDLKRAYRKLALKFHPDKNKAPGAQDAFKAIGNAYSVLADPSKRQRYDTYGPEEEQTSRRGGRRSNGGYYYYDDYSRGFEADVSPEEIFNMFFGGGFPTYEMRHRRRQRHHHHGDEGGNAAEAAGRNVYSLLLQFAPILLLMLMSLLSGLMQRDPWYSLSANNVYADERHTLQHSVPYFVKPNFHSEFTGSLGQLEAEIEDDFFHTLRVKCYRERSYKESMQFRAKYYQDMEAYKIASKLTTPHCDMLHKYGG